MEELEKTKAVGTEEFVFNQTMMRILINHLKCS